MEVRGRYGKMFVMGTDWYIGQSFEKYGEYGEEEVQLMRNFIDSDSVVFDVGANIGALTVPLAIAAGTVVAFEPQPEVFELLKLNCTEHHNVVVNNLGLGSRNTKMYVPKIDYSTTGNFGGVSLCEDKQDTVVDVAKLDDYMAGVCDLIKIDVEGMELEVLKGGTDTIKRCKPILYVENDREEKSADLISYLMQLGYRMWWHKPRLFNQFNYKNCQENVFSNIVSCNMLCVPAGREFEVTDVMVDVYELKKINSSADKPFEDVPLPESLFVEEDKGWVAVARFGGIGDNMIAASVLPLLKKQGYKVEVITDEKNGALFKNNPYIDKLAIKKDGDLPNDCGLEWQKWFRSRSSEYVKMIHLSHTIEGLLAHWPSQTAFYWPAKVRRELCGKSYLEMVHDIAEVPYEFSSLFYPTATEHKQAIETRRKVGDTVVGWVVKGSRGDKVYPYSPMAVARLIKECGVSVVLFCGVGEDYKQAAQIQEHVKNQNGSDAGLHVASTGNPDDWPTRRALTFAQHMDVMVGPDTGVMWSVAMEKLPKVMLLSHAGIDNITKHWVNTTTLHAEPERVKCWPCHQLHDSPDTCCPNKDNNGAACISDISIDSIINTVRRYLA